LSGQAPKPHFSSVETTFSTVSAITNEASARANAPPAYAPTLSSLAFEPI
jgi:hypothetical protein